jgi:hypothetical protein
MKGGASIGQHYTYNSPDMTPGRPFSFVGGKRKSKRKSKTRKAPMYEKLKKGGFYPSLMGGVLSNGPLLVPAALGQGMRLWRNNTKRMATRKRKQTRRTKN